MPGRIIIALALLFGVVNLASAGKNDATWNPPPEFDHPFSGRLIERKLPQAQVIKECPRYSSKCKTLSKKRNPKLLGCSCMIAENTCLIIYHDKKLGIYTPQSTLRHEIGHCNGWTHN